MYGHFYLQLCYFEKEQDDYTPVINEYQGDWDIDEKCPLTMCSMHAGFGIKQKNTLTKLLN
jgi:hypothetical protein